MKKPNRSGAEQLLHDE